MDAELIEKVARAIDPVAWGFIDRARRYEAESGEKHPALLLTLTSQLAQAERAIAALSATPQAAQVPALHPRTADLVQRFAAALTEKLAAAEAKYGYSDQWAEPGWMQECRAKLVDHVEKGDPRDVAAYCAFLWHHGEQTAMPSPQAAQVPAGYTVVPVEPTEAMVRAVFNVLPDRRLEGGIRRQHRRRYIAMLAAAQAQGVG